MLLKKLGNHGVREKTLSWVNNYSKDRSQKTNIASQLFKWREVTSGVQWAVGLVSVLLNTFITVVEKWMSRKVTKLSSDKSLFQIERIRADSEELQRDYRRLLE